jgi:hypothetical protein
MTDASLFTSGALFTQDYLVEGITDTAQYRDVDVADARAKLTAIFAGFPYASGPNEATTEGDLIWPILNALGWSEYLTQQNLSASGRVDVPDGLLFIDAAAKANANTHPEEYKRYRHGAAIIESKRWGRALDRAEGRKGDDKDTPSTQLLRYLRRIDDLTNGDLRWGVLTNGRKWRLYFSGARSTIDDYLEIDLGRIMRLDGDLLDTGISDEERDHWLGVFVAMFARTAFARASEKAPSFHDTARRDAALYEERVAASLSDLVFKRLYPTLGKAVAASAPADTELEQVREATLILLYRLLFVLYAEDRGLLPVKDSRFDDYALRNTRLDIGRRKDAGDIFSSVAKTIWSKFADLAEMIDKGDPSVGLPPYNGGLFNGEQTPLLKTIRLGDDVMAEAIDILSFEQRGGERRYINYRDLSVQQLGSIYERLLEFELTRDENGAVDIRPNIFARKNSGSYYTPDDLVLLILDETLEPLITDAMTAFETALADLNAKDSEDYRITQLQKADPAKAITRLRICDPAMGSGHFLVSLVDRLTDHTLVAIGNAAAMAAQVAGLDYESPVAEDIRKIRATIRHNAQDANWSVSEEQLDDPQLVKRMVLKRCVYGADKNPMAVELAKVSLWLHTFTVGAPLSFIDHHLAAGDSLFGLWVRDAIDKAGKGAELFLYEPLQHAQTQAVVMRTIEALTDAEIAEAHRSAEMWRGVEAQTGPLENFVSFMHAVQWLNFTKPEEKAAIDGLLIGQFGDPISIIRGRTEPVVKISDFKKEGATDRVRKNQFDNEDLIEPLNRILASARELISEERFLNWQITFPGVWDHWGSTQREGGFDAVVGNPPWDRIKLQQVEWFAARRPEIAKAQRASDRKMMVAALKENGDPLYDDFLKAEARALASARMARASGQFPLLSQGDIDIYKLFVERSTSLVNSKGMVGLVTPIGIGADNSTADFFSGLSKDKRLKAFLSFENRRHWLFADVHAEDQPTVLIFSGHGRVSEEFKYAVKLHRIPNPGSNNVQRLTYEILSKLNPNTSTAPILRDARDLPLISGIYLRNPVLVDRSNDAYNPAWPVRYVTMFHMTNDSHLFRTRIEMEEREVAWPIGGNRWQSATGVWLPLFEGKSIQIYNHRYAGITFSQTGTSGQGISIHADVSELQNQSFETTPRYWVDGNETKPRSLYHFAFNGICNSNNERTLISAIIPDVGCGNSLPILELEDGLSKCLLQGNFGSIVLDYVLRQKLQSRNLNKYIVEQLPVIPPAAYARQFGPKSAADIVKAAVLELTYTAHDIAPFARDMGHVDKDGEVLPPFIWDEERRLHLRARLDALYFILYGVFDPAEPAQSRDDIRYIYSTFPIVERQETAAYGSYRSRDLCLAYINTLIAGQPDAIVAG